MKAFKEITHLQKTDTRIFEISALLTDFFNVVSLHMECVLPRTFVQFVENTTDSSERASKVDEVMKDIFSIEDRSTLEKFLTQYVSKVTSTDQSSHSLIIYLKDPEFNAHLDKASHLDISEMISTVQKCMLQRLCKIVQTTQIEVSIKDDQFRFLIAKFQGYEWVCNLLSIQPKVQELIEQSTITLAGLTSIGLSLSQTDFSSLQMENQYLSQLIHNYCVIEKHTTSFIVSFKSANLSLKNVMEQISIENSEIHFICTECFYIDTSMDSSIDSKWCAKNIAIVAPKVCVVGNCIIDVSGRQEDPESSKTKALNGTPICTGFGEGKAGFDGKNGLSGQSGGNILIASDNIINPTQLTLQSCGANGKDGQDGGDGSDGRAQLSEEDTLKDWSQKFAGVFGGKKDEKEQDKIKGRMKRLQNFREAKTVGKRNYIDSVSQYGETENGVKVLFGFVDGFFKRHGFLFAKSKDGISADGGDGGRGGRGGGGGKAGDIQIRDLTDQPANFLVKVVTYDGIDGKAGTPGRPGKKAVAKRLSDHLSVSQWGPFDGDKSYPPSTDPNPWCIDIRPGTKYSKSNSLGKGDYFCHSQIAQMMNSSIGSDTVCFQIAEKSKICLTENNSQAIDGNIQQQLSPPVPTTKNKSVNKTALLNKFALLENVAHLDSSVLLQRLNHLDMSLRKAIRDGQNSHQLQCKKVHNVGNRSTLASLVSHLNVRPICSQAIADQVPLPESLSAVKEKLTHSAKKYPCIVEPLVNCIHSKEFTWSNLYFVLLETIENESNNELDISYRSRALTRVEQLRFSKPFTKSILFLLQDILVDIVHAIQFEKLSDIKKLVDILTKVHKKSDLSFESVIKKSITAILSPGNVLFKKCKRLVFEEVHRRFVNYDQPSTVKTQLKVVQVFKMIDSEERIEFLMNWEYKSLSAIKCYSGTLGPYLTALSTKIPLESRTKDLLKLLMAVFNEVNQNEERNCGVIYFPNLLKAVEDEYAIFHHTILDSDLLFVINYLQEKLIHLITKTKLQELLCIDLVTDTVTETFLKDCQFLVHERQKYRIICVEYKPQNNFQISLKKLPHFTKEVSLLNANGSKVIIFKDRIIKSPESVLVSSVDTEILWEDIRDKIIRKGSICEVKSIRQWTKMNIEHREVLLSALQRACAALDTSFDVLSFHRPSHWVEQLLFAAIRKKYCDADSNFFTEEVRESISGLSDCYDKSVYFTFFNLFLQTSSKKYSRTELLEVLQNMKVLFIEYKLCTFVTVEGITQVCGQNQVSVGITDSLHAQKIIDPSGSFITTKDELERHCKFNTKKISLDVAAYLKNQFEIQCSCTFLSEKELTLWNHAIHDLRIRTEITGLANGFLNNDEYNELLLYVYMLEQHNGLPNVHKFFQGLKSSNTKFPVYFLRTLFMKCAHKEWTMEIILNKLVGMLQQVSNRNFQDVLDKLGGFDWEQEYHEHLESRDTIIEFIKTQFQKEYYGKLDNIIKTMEQIEMAEKCPSQIQPQRYPIIQYTKHDIERWAIEVRGKKTLIEGDLFNETFALIRRAITIFYNVQRKQEGVVPRDTQMVACLLFFLDVSQQGGASQGIRMMQQIATGEGKTMVICMVAIFRALLGEKVDIVSSSSVLATRDAKEQKELYSLFKISVSHCCHQELTRRQKAYQADVIYGDVSSFQRDILETNFYDKSVRTSHNFDNVFIDEVDSMLVDKGETMLYLPHDIPDMNTLEPIYLEIWCFVNADDYLGLPAEQEYLYNTLKHKFFGGIQPDAFSNAVSTISKDLSEKIHSECSYCGLIDKEFHVPLAKDIQDIKKTLQKIHSVPSISLQEIVLVFQEHLKLVPTTDSIPEELHVFIKKNLMSWIQSATVAKFYQPNKEYIIDIDRRESASDRYPKIIIMDNETGVEQESSEWSNGLHQFLQLKHHLRLTTESIKSVYMSNISFFTKYYVNVMGVTGTLGSTAEEKLFQKLYQKTKLVIIPPFKPSRLRIETPTCCESREEWERVISDEIDEKCTAGRAVLLICADIKHAKHLYQYFTEKNPQNKVKLYTSSHQPKLEEDGKIEPGILIIATNLAGRGTDIKLSERLEKNGGLHVCLTYLPPNIRVEQQAYGRAARNGGRGSCKLIFQDSNDFSHALCKRNAQEAHRVADIEANYFYNISFQEELFQLFEQKYKRIKEKYSNSLMSRPKLDYFLDSWALFLDQHCTTIEAIPKLVGEQQRNADRECIREALENLTSKLEDDAMSSKRFMQLGHCYTEKHEWNLALEAYKNAKTMNPNDPFALYFEASALFNDKLKRSSGAEICRELKQTFYKLIPLFQQKIDDCQAHIVVLRVANHQQTSLTDGTTFYDEQKEHQIEMYTAFLESILAVVGYDIDEQTFSHVDWDDIPQGTKFVYTVLKEKLELKDCHISKHNYKQRLSHLFTHSISYYTFHSKIQKRVDILKNKRKIEPTDFEGIFPDKRHFWTQLCTHQLITVPEDQKRNNSYGYWNPENEAQINQLDLTWNHVNKQSFSWIAGLFNIEGLISYLKRKQILTSTGKLTENEQKPFELPVEYEPFYKQIKDTLKFHCVYQYVLGHLRNCSVINANEIIGDSPQEQPASRSIVDLINSMNPCMNASSATHTDICPTTDHDHPSKTDPKLQSWPDNGSLGRHLPTSEMNHSFAEQLIINSLGFSQVSGEGCNCFINALIQHAKRDYLRERFDETDRIRASLLERYPECTDMLHSDNLAANYVLQLVNDLCASVQNKISVISEVVASSEGPILCTGCRDSHYTNARHEVVWQQGAHFVSIFQKDLLCSLQTAGKYSVLPKEKSCVKLTRKVLDSLLEKRFVKTKGSQQFKIVTGLNIFEKDFQRALPPHERQVVREFFQYKLKVDFSTLSNCPVHLMCDQHVELYRDLCLYSVIKMTKIKKDIRTIDNVFNYSLSAGYVKDLIVSTGKTVVKERSLPSLDAVSGRPNFSKSTLKSYFILRNMTELSEEKLTQLLQFLERRHIVSVISDRYIILTADTLAKYKKDIESSQDRSVDLAQFPNQAQKECIEQFLQLIIHLHENNTFIILTLKSKLSALLGLETPHIKRVKLSDLFEKRIQIREDVFEQFSNNQCSWTIRVAEKRWSMKSNVTAAVIIAIGVAQVVVGIVCSLKSAGLALPASIAVLTEGISDSVYGITGLIKGHCRWSDYAKHKLVSVALSVSTIGFSAFLAGFRAAPTAGRLCLPSIKSGLAAVKNAFIAKQITQVSAEVVSVATLKNVIIDRVGKQINGELAISYTIEKSSKTIETLSTHIVECLTTIRQDEALFKKMFTFLCQHEHSEKKLRQVTLKVLHNYKHTFLTIWDSIEQKALQAGGSKCVKNFVLENLGAFFLKAYKTLLMVAPVILELIKIGFVSKRMSDFVKHLKEVLDKEYIDHFGAQSPRDCQEKELSCIINAEIEFIIKSISLEVHERANKIIRTSLQIVSKGTKHLVMKQCLDEKYRSYPIEKRMEDIILSKSQKMNIVVKPSSLQTECEKKLLKISCSPEVFSQMIDYFGLSLEPEFVMRSLVTLVAHPIILQKQNGERVIEVDYKDHSVGNLLIVTQTSDKMNKTKSCYKVGKKCFSYKTHGNDYFIEAVLEGASNITGQKVMDVSNAKKHLATTCLKKGHWCYKYLNQLNVN